MALLGVLALLNLMPSVTIAPALQTKSFGVLSGPTDSKMIHTLEQGIMRGVRTFVIQSRGGRESVALDIAEMIEKHDVKLVVHGFCLSACSQYILPAASAVYIRPDSLVSYHLNSAGMLSLHGIALAKLVNRAEVMRNAQRAKALYRRRGIREDLLVDAQNMMVPVCISYGDRGARLFARYDAWVPSLSYVKSAGFKFTGFWPASGVAAQAPIRRIYRDPSRIKFGDPARGSRNGVMECPS